MRRAALVTGVTAAVALCLGMPPAVARPGDGGYYWGRSARSYYIDDYQWRRKKRATEERERRPNRADESKANRTDKAPVVPRGLLHVIVSLDKQRATLFADGQLVASTSVSSGTPTHPTPMGVFSVLQKNRHHISNLYDAPMPYMQRLTWSGTALHEGPLPGYPASHGCVRLPNAFAQLLWKSTKIGARVIITGPEVTPVEIVNAHLFTPKPQPSETPVGDASPSTAALTKTADAASTSPRVVVPDVPAAAAVKPAHEALAIEQPTKLVGPAIHVIEPAASGESETTASSGAASLAGDAKPAPAPAVLAPSVATEQRPRPVPAIAAREASRKPISMFVSLKEAKLYVRQGSEPLFDAPVTIARPDQPIGTHVFTAMGLNPDGVMRWTVVSIPSSSRPVVEQPRGSDRDRKPRHERAVKTVQHNAALPGAGAALDRLVIPAETADRIAEMIAPGSSLIITDNKLSDETSRHTDFIVTTR